jgi:hypothetical protein
MTCRFKQSKEQALHTISLHLVETRHAHLRIKQFNLVMPVLYKNSTKGYMMQINKNARRLQCHEMLKTSLRVDTNIVAEYCCLKATTRCHDVGFNTRLAISKPRNVAPFAKGELHVINDQDRSKRAEREQLTELM